MQEQFPRPEQQPEEQQPEVLSVENLRILLSNVPKSVDAAEALAAKLESRANTLIDHGDDNYTLEGEAIHKDEAEKIKDIAEQGTDHWILTPEDRNEQLKIAKKDEKLDKPPTDTEVAGAQARLKLSNELVGVKKRPEYRTILEKVDFNEAGTPMHPDGKVMTDQEISIVVESVALKSYSYNVQAIRLLNMHGKNYMRNDKAEVDDKKGGKKIVHEVVDIPAAAKAEYHKLLRKLTENLETDKTNYRINTGTTGEGEKKHTGYRGKEYDTVRTTFEQIPVITAEALIKARLEIDKKENDERAKRGEDSLPKYVHPREKKEKPETSDDENPRIYLEMNRVQWDDAKTKLDEELQEAGDSPSDPLKRRLTAFVQAMNTRRAEQELYRNTHVDGSWDLIKGAVERRAGGRTDRILTAHKTHVQEPRDADEMNRLRREDPKAYAERDGDNEWRERDKFGRAKDGVVDWKNDVVKDVKKSGELRKRQISRLSARIGKVTKGAFNRRS